MILRARAPLRISFCGGGTDVSPYPEEKGGAILNATINKYAHATLVTTGEPYTHMHSLDMNYKAIYDPSEPPVGPLALVIGALNHIKPQKGIDIYLHTDAPPGSGLGASSSMCVALTGLLKDKCRMTSYDIAELAWKIERLDCGMAGGKQDQYAAAFGGFNLMEFHKDHTIVTPLRIPDGVVNELQYRSLLCFTGQCGRKSASIIDDQSARYKAGANIKALDFNKAATYQMKDALMLGRFDDFGELLNETWKRKQEFSPMIATERINEMYEVGRRAGAIGGKLLGAGGGGYLLFLVQFDKWHAVARVLEEHGGKIMHFGFEQHGLQTWETKEKNGRYLNWNRWPHPIYVKRYLNGRMVYSGDQHGYL